MVIKISDDLPSRTRATFSAGSTANGLTTGQADTKGVGGRSGVEENPGVTRKSP